MSLDFWLLVVESWHVLLLLLEYLLLEEIGLAHIPILHLHQCCRLVGLQLLVVDEFS